MKRVSCRRRKRGEFPGPIWDRGIRATDNYTGQEFFFYTDVQSDVEGAMLLMGYGCRDYNLSFFKGRLSTVDREVGGV